MGKKKKKLKILFICALPFILHLPNSHKKILPGHTFTPDFQICYYEKKEKQWNVTVIFKVFLPNLQEIQRDFKLLFFIFFIFLPFVLNYQIISSLFWVSHYALLIFYILLLFKLLSTCQEVIKEVYVFDLSLSYHQLLW